MKKATALATSTPLDFSRAKKYLEAAQKSQQVGLALHALVGAEIEHLRNTHCIQQGGDRRSKSHGETLNFQELLEKELGISKPTAYRYDQLWRAVKPRLKKIGTERETFEEILALPLDRLTGAHQDLLVKAVTKITDGKTYRELVQGDLFKSGNRTASTPAPKGPGHDPLSDPMPLQAVDAWGPILRDLVDKRNRQLLLHLPQTEGPVNLHILRGIILDLAAELKDAAK